MGLSTQCHSNAYEQKFIFGKFLLNTFSIWFLANSKHRDLGIFWSSWDFYFKTSISGFYFFLRKGSSKFRNRFFGKIGYEEIILLKIQGSSARI
jgi:hypothetical protein